ncbi:MAG: hypothetical protein D6708_01830, partial [Candidatus Dadabacteria bacterium]
DGRFEEPLEEAMDPIRAKKIAAAVAGVLEYLAEAQAAAAPAPELAAPAAPAPGPAPSAWALAGRHDTMLFRTLWQRRVARPG